MAAPAAGVGYLIANDILTDCSYSLVEPPVKAVVPAGGITVGVATVPVWDLAMYVGAQVLVGVLGGDLEVVTITAAVVGTSFTATFANAHAVGEPIVGATFPVRQTTDQFFTQSEMLGYLSQAQYDFLNEVPLAIAVATVDVPPSGQNTPLPSDCMYPVRVATNSYPLRETSQSNLDSMDYRWQEQAATAPYTYFRDKTGLGNVGVWPRQNNTVPLEVIYAQRSPVVMGIADGFIIPDPFLLYVLCRTLSMAFSKDGEQRNPGLAKYWQQRYETGVKISNIFLGIINDSNFDAAQ
jgi:hypothetical protein